MHMMFRNAVIATTVREGHVNLMMPAQLVGPGFFSCSFTADKLL